MLALVMKGLRESGEMRSLLPLCGIRGDIGSLLAVRVKLFVCKDIERRNELFGRGDKLRLIGFFDIILSSRLCFYNQVIGWLYSTQNNKESSGLQLFNRNVF